MMSSDFSFGGVDGCGDEGGRGCVVVGVVEAKDRERRGELMFSSDPARLDCDRPGANVGRVKDKVEVVGVTVAKSFDVGGPGLRVSELRYFL